MCSQEFFVEISSTSGKRQVQSMLGNLAIEFFPSVLQLATRPIASVRLAKFDFTDSLQESLDHVHIEVDVEIVQKDFWSHPREVENLGDLGAIHV